MNRWLAICGLTAVVSLGIARGAETGAVSRITSAMVSNQVASVDGFVKDGRIEAYGDLLAADLVVVARFAPGVVPGEGPAEEQMNREQYLDSLREMLEDARITAHTSNITKLEIQADGLQGTADMITFQQYKETGGGMQMSMAAEVKSTFILRGGLLLITRLEFTVTDLVMK